jgi:ureidoacrylate peracid hydrolase
MSEDDGLTLDPKTTALLVVDMQNDFCHPEGYYARNGRPAAPIAAAVEPIAGLLPAARAAGLATVFTRIVYATQADLADEHGVRPAAWSGSGIRLQVGSWGAEIVDELRPMPGEPVFDKPAYSAFYQTELEEWLRSHGIRTVVVTGTVAYACVLHTAFDAFVRGFDVLLVEDAVSSWFDDLADAARRITQLLLGRTISSKELVAALQQR